MPPEGQRPGPLPEPPPDLDRLPLPLVAATGPWVRLYRSALAPLYFGATGDNRFDAPSGEYDVCYVADDLHGAFIETFGWTTGIRVVTTAALATRSIVQIETSRPLHLVDLTGPGLARLGADERLGVGDHAPARRWAEALWRHPERPDGLRYRSRHDPSRISVALYDRVRANVRTKSLGGVVDPSNARLIAAILDHYGIGLIQI